MMRNKGMVMFLVSVLVFLSLSVFASAEVGVSSGLTEGKVMVNVDYNQLGEDDDDTETLNYFPALTFENKGNDSETVNLELVGVPAGYQVELSETDKSFRLSGVGEADGSDVKKEIVLKITVPIDKDLGTHSIGELKVSGTTNAIGPVLIESKVKSMLELNEIKVYVGGKSEDGVSKDGGVIEKVPPGKEVELRFELENLFDKDYANGDIDNADLTVKFADSDDEDDFGDDIDEEVEDIDINADETLEGGEAQIIKFKVPDEAKEKSYKLLVVLEGKDDNKAEHKVEWTIELEVDREKDDVRVTKAYLVNEAITCETKETQLKVTMVNFGSNSQDEAALKIYSSDQEKLKLDYSFADIFMDKDPDEDDNSFSKTITIPLEGVKAGEYTIFVRAYIDDDEEVDGTSLKLTVGECEAEKEEVKKEEESIVIVQTMEEEEEEEEGAATTVATTEAGVVETVETPFSQVKGVVIFMGVITALLIVLIILMVCLLVKKR